MRITLLVLFHCVVLSFGAVVHKNHHGGHLTNDLSKERESDGAYAPKERQHYDEAGK